GCSRSGRVTPSYKHGLLGGPAESCNRYLAAEAQSSQGGQALLCGELAFGDGFLGAMEVHQAQVRQPWCNDGIRWITSHSATSNSHLHDVDAGGQDINQRRHFLALRFRPG